ncbi:MAG: Alpha-acetolactate decarboxylase precursor [Elusimicrobia bacterium ADurb.Bin231]|nr:MAG: Alpha-acetolactate decarboxylase precursor [Elusimicrobia bacterium ADurb.Bin231]
MKKTPTKLIFAFLFSACIFGCAHQKKSKDVLYQTSTINALLNGLYDGEVTIKDLKKYGDTAIGTFNMLDGEMLALNGSFYQVKYTGEVVEVPDTTKTPFAVVTFFETDKLILFNKDTDMNMERLQTFLRQSQISDNLFYAIIVKGDFGYVKTRSVPSQQKPYPVLADVVETQAVFESRDVKGTIIGFFSPPYVKGINVPGYHFHFISEDKKFGGHLLECTFKKGEILIDITDEFFMALPQNSEFLKSDLSGEKEAELKKVEK